MDLGYARVSTAKQDQFVGNPALPAVGPGGAGEPDQAVGASSQVGTRRRPRSS